MIIHTPYVHGGDIYRNRVTLDFSVNVNPLGTPEAVRTAVRQAAGIAALDCPEWPEKARQLITREKNYLYRELRGLGICVLPGDANYLLLSGVPQLFERLLKKGILIRNCENYRGLTTGDCRIAVRTHEENKALIETIREVIHE